VRIASLLALFCAPALLAAAPYSGVLFLRVPIGARPAALGGAYCALSDDASATLWGPAGLAHLRRNELTFTHNRWFTSSRLNNVSTAWRLGRAAVLGAALTHVGYGVLPVYDANGTVTGEFSPYEASAALACGFLAPDWLALGVGVKGNVQHTWDSDIQSWACDAGAQWSLTDRMTLGFSASNIGRYLWPGDANTSLPVTLRTGFAQRFGSDNLIIVGDIVWTREQRFTGSVGAELGTTGFRLRGGLTTGSAGQSLGSTAGVGFALGSLKLDYAYVPNLVLGATHQISLEIVF
jgi:hypothetical protein